MVSTTVSQIAFGMFIALFVARYLRTIVGIFTYLSYKPKPVADKPKYGPEDATVVVPTTFKSPSELIQCLKSIMSCSPGHVIVVTSEANVQLVQTCCGLNSFPAIEVLGVKKLNKRVQMLKALQQVKTDITVFADDDVFWPFQYLEYLLAIFEDENVGAGGTRQRARRNKMDCWNFLGISYLQRRVWNNVTTNAIDGSLSTLSGRTAAYRTEILRTGEFFNYFNNDCWYGRRLNTDDDKCLTRYVYAHGWQIALQFDHRSIIETTLEENPRYVSQCVRWARSHWRGNFTVMSKESYWCSSRHWWGAYAIYLGQFQTPAVFVDGSLFALLLAATEHMMDYRLLALRSLGLWIVFTKIVKLVPHFYCHPEDLKFVPVSIMFSYLHGLINIYALLTLHVTIWGSQNLEELKTARAEGDGVIPLLRGAMAEAEPYREPTPGRITVGDDYFAVRQMTSTTNSYGAT